MALPFDPDKLRATGSVVPVAEDVRDNANVGFGAFSSSENGVLLYRLGASAGRNRTLVWLDRSGKQLEVKSEAKQLVDPAAFTGRKARRDFHGPLRNRRGYLAPGPGARRADKILLQRRIGAESGLVSGRQLHRFFEHSCEELLLHGGVNAFPSDISPDGKLLVYSETEAKTKDDLWLLPLQGDRKPVKYLNSPFNEYQAQFSSDGEWMAYQSNESGQFQVYVQPIPATGAKRQISTLGGSRPRWRRDGTELFYVSADLKLMAVPVKVGSATPDFGAPRQLFDKLLPIGAGREFGYQPSADGQKFLALVPAEGEASAPPPVTIRMNWQAGLKK